MTSPTASPAQQRHHRADRLADRSGGRRRRHRDRHRRRPGVRQRRGRGRAVPAQRRAARAEDTVPPYATSWNTTTVANGSYTLTAVARDAATNQTTSAAVRVTVANGPTGGGAGAGYALRFYGNGVNDIDRVKIQIDDPATTAPGPPADVGATDFTIEFWFRALAAENPPPPSRAAPTTTGSSATSWWIGIASTRAGPLACRSPASSSSSACSATGRARSPSVARATCSTISGITLPCSGAGRTGGCGCTSTAAWKPRAMDPTATSPTPTPACRGTSAAGSLHQQRSVPRPRGREARRWPAVSVVCRMAGRVPAVERPALCDALHAPGASVRSDASTVALYHFDEGAGDVIVDTPGVSGGPSHGVRRFGGTPAGPQWVISDAPLARGRLRPASGPVPSAGRSSRST